jgi:hypothetical protein
MPRYEIKKPGSPTHEGKGTKSIVAQYLEVGKSDKSVGLFAQLARSFGSTRKSHKSPSKSAPKPKGGRRKTRKYKK